MTNHPNRGRSQDKVDLVRYFSGFANRPDRFEVYQGRVITDQRYDVESYWLPPGYTVTESNGGTQEIYDDKGNHCEIIEHSSGRPQLISTMTHMPVLKRA